MRCTAHTVLAKMTMAAAIARGTAYAAGETGECVCIRLGTAWRAVVAGLRAGLSGWAAEDNEDDPLDTSKASSSKEKFSKPTSGGRNYARLRENTGETDVLAPTIISRI